MKASGPPRDTVDGLQRSINEKQSEFTNDLDKLYQHQAQRYLDDAYDRYLSFEEAECVVMSNKPPSTLPNFRASILFTASFIPTFTLTFCSGTRIFIYSSVASFPEAREVGRAQIPSRPQVCSAMRLLNTPPHTTNLFIPCKTVWPEQRKMRKNCDEDGKRCFPPQ